MHPFLLYYNYNEALHYNAFITRKLPSPSHTQENLRHLLQLKAKGANTICTVRTRTQSLIILVPCDFNPKQY